MEEMKKKDLEMDKHFAYSIIDKADFGSLATINEDNTPYSVPISFVRKENIIYIHSSIQGTKIRNITKTPEVSMSFVGDINTPFPIIDEEIYIGRKLSEIFTTEFESAVIFGIASRVENRNEKILALKLLCEKYTPNNMDTFNEKIKDSMDFTTIIRIEIKKITGRRKRYDEQGKKII